MHVKQLGLRQPELSNDRDGAIDIGFGMARGEGETNPTRTGGNGRRPNRDRVDATFAEKRGRAQRSRLRSNPPRDDGPVTASVGPKLTKCVAEVRGVSDGTAGELGLAK